MKTNIIWKRFRQRIDELAKEISRINEALGVDLVTIEDDGIYREFKNGEKNTDKSRGIFQAKGEYKID